MDDLRQIVDAAESAEFSIYGPDLLCRALAVIYHFGGEDFVFKPALKLIAAKGQALMVKAHAEKDIEILRKFQGYAKQVEMCQADWLEPFCHRFNITITNNIKDHFPVAQ
jgi:hypothetical protein